MPYKRVGTDIMTLKEGAWKRKQGSGSVDRAKSAMKLLSGLEGQPAPEEAEQLRRKPQPPRGGYS